MAGLTRLAPPVESVEAPARLSISRIVSSGECLLRPILPPVQPNLLPPIPAAVWGRVVHSLFDSIAKGEIEAEDDPRTVIERKLVHFLDKTNDDLSSGPFAFRLSRLEDAFTSIEWNKRFQIAVEDGLALFRRSDPRQSGKGSAGFDLRAALGRPGFFGSEVPLPETPLRLAGRMDAIRVLPDKVVRITDYKTGSAFDEDGKVREGVVNQLNLYALAISELVPTAEIEVEVVGGEKAELARFDETSKQATSDRLQSILGRLPAGRSLRSSEVAQVGEQCRNCEFRHSCPSLRTSAPELWKRPDNPFPTPLDIAGTVLDVEQSDGTSITLKIKDLAGRVVKVHRLDPRNNGVPSIQKGESVWFFSLASIEPLIVSGAWRHPRNFHELPSSPSERRAWTLTVFSC